MSFVNAFIVGGALCALFQIPLSLTKLGVPKLLIIGLGLGGVGSAIGLCDWLASVGGGGFSVMLVGAAQAVYGSFMSLFQGAWLPLCIVLGVFAALVVLGLIAGAWRTALESKAK